MLKSARVSVFCLHQIHVLDLTDTDISHKIQGLAGVS